LDLSVLNIIFQVIVFLLAISVHESAHAWMANRCGDPTAKMLGRITLNPIKHIDPIGTVLVPLIGIVGGFGIFGWAKPCPVDPRNFKNEVRDDIYTSVVGPVSNLMLVSIAGVVFVIATLVFQDHARLITLGLTRGAVLDTGSLLTPLLWFCYTMVTINVLLAVFNLLPIPPLDGSHVIRHLLPDAVRDIYDSVGMFGFIILFLFAGKILKPLLQPIWQLVNSLLLNL
jgi:Zn-dependent protease